MEIIVEKLYSSNIKNKSIFVGPATLQRGPKVVWRTAGGSGMYAGGTQVC